MYDVLVYYTPAINREFDDALENLGEEHGGKWIGSGTCLATAERDIQFEFKNKKATQEFAAAAQRLIDSYSNLESKRVEFEKRED